MDCNYRCNINPCVLLGVFVSIVFGAVIGILFAFGLLPGIVTALWIVFGLAVLLLVILIASIFFGSNREQNALQRCLCRNTTLLLVGILGTILLSIVALSITLVTTSLIAALIAAIAFFFTLMVMGLICIIQCILCKSCGRMEEQFI